MIGETAEFMFHHQCFTAEVDERRFACTSHRLAVGLEAHGSRLHAQFQMQEIAESKQGGEQKESAGRVPGSTDDAESDVDMSNDTSHKPLRNFKGGGETEPQDSTIYSLT